MNSNELIKNIRNNILKLERIIAPEIISDSIRLIRRDLIALEKNIVSNIVVDSKKNSNLTIMEWINLQSNLPRQPKVDLHILIQKAEEKLEDGYLLEEIIVMMDLKAKKASQRLLKAWVEHREFTKRLKHEQNNNCY